MFHLLNFSNNYTNNIIHFVDPIMLAHHIWTCRYLLISIHLENIFYVLCVILISLSRSSLYNIIYFLR